MRSPSALYLAALLTAGLMVVQSLGIARPAGTTALPDGPETIISEAASRESLTAAGLHLHAASYWRVTNPTPGVGQVTDPTPGVGQVSP